MNTRRYPRTCDEAFGPYQRSSQCPIEPMPEPQSAFDRALPVVYAACLVGFIAALVFNNWSPL